MSNIQTYYYFKLDFQKVDQRTGGKFVVSCISEEFHHIFLPHEYVAPTPFDPLKFLTISPVMARFLLLWNLGYHPF